ncbi:hypothetical protein [Sinorhizobium medicae]|uniref:hypothetical protein n=1 Tax=Sinorhizobium medicae TaxID=110321 RepID=UPI0003FA1758|nr:hypothetical protein [Sinorhizobium medicae]
MNEQRITEMAAWTEKWLDEDLWQKRKRKWHIIERIEARFPQASRMETMAAMIRVANGWSKLTKPKAVTLH